ncbi:MAG TPA: hypothetical protein VE913_02290 [Longimicrobium sp.]|nr:hypothetical protein [Longimicrobium sp.]
MPIPLRATRARRLVAAMCSCMAVLAACDTPTRPAPTSPTPEVPPKVEAGVPTTIEAASPLAFEGNAGTNIVQPMMVLVRDQKGQPIHHAVVTWTAGGGQIPSSSPTTADGITKVAWRLPTTAGPVTASATINGLPPVTFTATVRPAIGLNITFTPSAVSVQAGYETTVTASFSDYYGNPAPTQPVEWISGDTSVTVFQDGTATVRIAARAPRITTITARAPLNLVGILTVTVTPLRFSTVATGARAGGGAWSCGITTTRAALHCWMNSAPIVVDSVGRFTSVSAEGPACALEQGGTVRCFATPALTSAGAFRQMETGSAHVCAVDAAGAAFCWGDGRWGQLGDGVTHAGGTQVNTPRPVTGGRAYTAVSAGGDHGCGVATGGSLWCWGLDASGELGRGTGGTRETCGLGLLPCSRAPVAVASAESFKAVSAGTNHTCALTAAGTAYCWGSNSAGQLGSGAVLGSTSNVPVAVAGGYTFSSISAGEAHTCAVRTDGAPICWGSNANGALGTGAAPTLAVNTPQLVVGGFPFASISAGQNTTCGLTTGGIAFCWGKNDAAQVGDGTRTDRPSPTRAMWQ